MGAPPLPARTGSTPQRGAVGQPTSFAVDLPVTGAPQERTVVDLRGDTGTRRWLTIQSRTGSQPTALRIVERLEQVDKVQTVTIGDGGGIELPVVGSVAVFAQTSTLGQVRLTISLAEEYFVQHRSLLDFTLGGLVNGGVGIPGAWTDVGPNAGWPMPFRPQVALYATSSLALPAAGPIIEFRFIDAAGIEDGRVNMFSGGFLTLFHPNARRLQARHPGDDGSTRRVLASWFRI